MPTPFEVISTYCQRNNKSLCIRDLAFSVYRQQQEDLVNETTSPEQISAIETALLSQGQLVGHVRQAEEILKIQFESEIRPYIRHNTLRTFGFAVLNGVVANIIYSIVLIIIFAIAKEQIASWLQSLGGTVS